MAKDYAAYLQGACPEISFKFNPELMIYTMTEQHPYVMDNHYYKNVRKGMGFLAKDQALYSSNETQDIVDTMARDEGAFQKGFGKAMIKMSVLGVKTGSEEQIRRDCRVFSIE
ncbi:hypothetical protein MLD38_019062 [Melastoma candidum]|uniref:Uncharacterized protein n=1 Tax=Melastoma candidum TaxID=119954 RepID=A0ACB9QWU9_9MYRT|nr:hypothetical protein MLD38_019062 [Melastoma candidum]